MRYAEFVVLMALIMSTAAMSIDTVLPALALIGDGLGVADDNLRQLVVGVFFIGMAGAQMLFGPLSDSLGRRPVLFAGLAVFALGCLISITAPSFEVMLAGRLIQGIGAAAPRVISVAIVRDRFEGRQMAKTISLIMTIFITVPIFAPMIGQGVVFFAGWRGIFWMFLAMAATTTIWSVLRLPETLTPDHRHPLGFGRVGRACLEVLRHRTTMAYLLATSCVFSALIGYLTSAQQIFQELYGLGPLFPVAFGGLAGSIGLASFVNSRVVVLLGMRKLVGFALTVETALALAFAGATVLYGGMPPFWLMFPLLVPMFFCHGMLFGNLNALAMQPMGHIAGSAAAVIGTGTTALSALLGSLVGQAYNGTVLPLALGFAGFSVLAVIFYLAAER